MVRQKRAIPARLHITCGARRLGELHAKSGAGGAVQSLWPATRVRLPQARCAVSIERMNPALDRARIVAKPSSDLITIAARADQCDAMQAMQEARFVGVLDDGSQKCA